MNEIFNQIKRFDGSVQFEDGKPFEFTLNKKSNGDYLFQPVEKMEVGKSYKITVKKYMTEPATSTFDFQDKWNNGVPMPAEVYTGNIEKETRGMYYMTSEEWSGWVIKSAIKEWEEI